MLTVERTLAAVTWRVLLGRRRWLALVVCNGLPALLAWLFVAQAGGMASDASLTFAGQLLSAVVLTGLLPLAGLVFGTTALGREIEDGTLGYVLAKPTARWRVVAVKLAVAAAATVVAVLPGVVLVGWIVLGDPAHALVRGFAAGTAVASILYAGLFLALRLFTRRALIVGLVYVIGWEGALSRLFAGTRTLSVREYATAVSEAVAASAGSSLSGSLASPLAPSTAVGMAALLLGVAVVLAVGRLRTLELVEEV